jgi:hypothetical protein
VRYEKTEVFSFVFSCFMDLKDPSVFLFVYIDGSFVLNEQAALPTEVNRYGSGLIFDPGINRGDSEKCFSFVRFGCFGRSLGKGLHFVSSCGRFFPPKLCFAIFGLRIFCWFLRKK